MKRLFPVLAAALGLAGGPATAGDHASGVLLGQNCAACHGTDGREFHEAMPPLAGMDRDNFIRAMERFKRGERAAIVMDRIASAFSREEIEVMADFFAAQQPVQYGQEEEQ